LKLRYSIIGREISVQLEWTLKRPFAVAAGVYDTVLVVGVEKLKDSGLQGLPDSLSRPMLGVGRTAPGSFALIASRYFNKYGIGKETLARIAVKNHKNGALNPKAHFQREITVEQALKAPIIAGLSVSSTVAR
jgi:acetyl-CoA C-acetyltransferase